MTITRHGPLPPVERGDRVKSLLARLASQCPDVFLTSDGEEHRCILRIEGHPKVHRSDKGGTWRQSARSAAPSLPMDLCSDIPEDDR